MWRNPHECNGSFSTVGPAPSHISGLIGASLGFASPWSQGATNPDMKKFEKMKKGGLSWPVSEELLIWLEQYDFHVACRWNGDYLPKRIQWNVNGLNNVKSTKDNLRIQQQVLLNPSYEVAVRINDGDVADKLAKHLKEPSFKLYLGASFCPAFVKKAQLQDEIDVGKNWAFVDENPVYGEATPLFKHVVNPEETFERLVSDGYWVYPMDEKNKSNNPFVKGYERLGLK